MPTRRQKSANTSRAIREQTIGSHVRSTSSGAKHTSVQFSSQRKSARAGRGEITHVVPYYSSGESAQDYSRRVRTVDYAELERRRARKRRVSLVAGLVVLALVAALLVGWLVYGQQIAKQLQLSDSDASAALVAPASDEAPYWTLVAVELRDAGHEYTGPGMLTLVRVDPASLRTTYLNVPSNVTVRLSDGFDHPLREAAVVGGDAELIERVAEVTGRRISHFAELTDDGLVEMVDALGGISVDLLEEVDDPNAGPVWIPAGEQELDGRAALTAVRAGNYAAFDDAQARARDAVVAGILAKVAALGGFDSVLTMDTISQDFSADLDQAQLSSLIAPFAGGVEHQVDLTRLPGATVNDGTYGRSFTVSASALNLLMERLAAGEPLEAGDPTEGAIDPHAVSVTVRNGANINGAGSATAELLRQVGYNVGDPTNTEAAVYNETLVVYRNGSLEPNAQHVVATMGCGRVADASIYYNFDTDLLVIIGADWIAPLS